MKKILLSFVIGSVLITGCESEKETSTEEITTIIKAEDREDPITDEDLGMKRQGEMFLQKVGTKENVTKTESGLMYEVIKEGDGEKPNVNSTVKVHYTGRFVNYKVFDSSVERGEPIEFRLTEVIKGWTEGVQLMKKGSKYRFFIPQNLAYGPKGYPGSIPPYSALIFEVELLDFK